MENYLTNLFNLEDKVAALTGAGGHLIGEISRGLAKAGVKVAILDSRIEKSEAVAAEIRDFGGQALPLRVDVRSKSDFEAALDEILEKWGDLHIAVNGAGINSPTPFLDISVEEWDEVLATQLTGTLLGCQVLGGYMVNRGYGAIMNISSASAGPPLSKAYAYSVAKAGIVNLTKNLAREWAPARVRVNALRPGFFPTDWNRKNFITPEREAAILGHTPMNRYGEVSELVGASLWMLSDAASFVTGAEIAVDGGFSAMSI
ncbi:MULTISPECIES: SDR family oxidoreductase [Mycobacterium]|uniref:D-mannonate oxidoreductase n=1 Tax=Mycobacterium kiyosense TaxID=2871094 RepID=A0A9P3UXM8_9MYCO|nr:MULTISPECIES: SDR family oxidoreductase [Mycobacterium]BDB43015.1 D-mannonate oxidoreductase [Mycobacterium kiyosense]BDE13769.1 D-mannonate oxidoreductase [Mycobacterium sp. 20KCMC460]GLB83018.1 D-mannonate oxidoreductase [Mycobacterium kiyosense]GLB88987.1 D-mannonate oxidoreductase [Mycobacterium kiyosense]GLB94408.1 D-mannonate oxidoreductase [Mycobacterium kiyosense]